MYLQIKKQLNFKKVLKFLKIIGLNALKKSLIFASLCTLAFKNEQKTAF
jgi:hypothetical protein